MYSFIYLNITLWYNGIDMKFEIMMKIMFMLLAKRKTTARQLASRFEVSERTIYRYIEELNICGVPIDVRRGRYGGVTIADTFRLPNGFFSREEYVCTINALAAMSNQVHNVNLITAIEKLQRQQKLDRQDMSVCGNIIVDGATWGDCKKFSEKMRACEIAVNESKSLMLDYISREGVHSKRVLDPYVLIYKQGVWYVYGFCHTKQTFRTFKVGRIKSATFTGKTFVKKEFKREQIDINFYYTPQDLIDVTLKIQTNSLADAEEWLGIDNVEPSHGGFIARVTLSEDGLVNKILSYGGAIQVIEPQSLKEKVLSAAKKILEY